MFELAIDDCSVRELTLQEAEEVSGGIINVLIGAAIGVGTYLLYQGMTGGHVTAGGLIGAGVAGGVTSGFSAIGAGMIASAAIGTGAGAAADNAATYYKQ